MMEAVVHGIVLALGLILPLGVQNVFIFNQGAGAVRWSSVLPVVVAASLCDTLLILLSVFGISLLLLSMAWLKTLLMIAGILFLIYMGWSIWNSDPRPASTRGEQLPLRKQILFAVSVSLLNPHAILDTIGVIGTSALGYQGQAKWGFTIGAISLSWIWFLALALAGRLIGSLDRAGGVLTLINKVSALMIWAVSMYIAVQLAGSL